MELESLRRGRRILSAAVSLAAVALVMAAMRGANDGAGAAVGSIASIAFVVTLTLLVVVWRKEHVASEAAFAARAEQQLATMKLQLELAKKKKQAESTQSASAAREMGQKARRTPQ